MFHTRNPKKRVGVGASDSTLSISQLTAYVANTTGTSMESEQIVSQIKGGDFLAADLEQYVQSFESGVLQGVVNDTTHVSNKTAVLSAALLRSFGGNPKAYMDMWSAEGMLPEGAAPYATSTASDFDNVYKQYSVEAFDNQSLTENLAISIGLTYNVARQGHAMELIYKLLALTPEQGAVDIEFTNLYVQNAVTHSPSGDLSDYNSKRVIDASIDHTIVADAITKIVPAWTEESAKNFVPTSVLAPFEYTDAAARRVVLTSGLEVGKDINLLGLGHVDQASKSGQADYRDALDRNVGVEFIFVTLGSSVIKFDLKGIPFTRFVKSPEGGGRELKLNAELTSLFLDANTVDVNGDAPVGAIWDTIRDGNYSVRLKFDLNGRVDVEYGNASVNPTPVRVYSVTNEAGALVPAETFEAIQEGLADLAVRSWWPDARVTNSNHRYLGQLLNTRSIRERLVTRTRSPVYVPFPLGEDRSQTVLDWLTYYVGKQINADGITKIFEYHDRLSGMLPGGRILGLLTPGDYEKNALPMEGVGRHLVNAYIDTVDFDITDLIQTRFTMENIDNAIEVISNQVRAICFNILQKTNYENACRYIDGGEIKRNWKFAFVTSNYIANFLTKTGDTRTFGAGLNFDLRSDVDARLQETMFLTIVREGDGIDPLSAGILLYTPSLVATISTTRKEAPNKEAIMQPRYEHYNLLPILVRINIKGVKEVLENLARFQVEAVIIDEETDAGAGGTGNQPGTPGPVVPGNGNDDGAGTGG